jgi:hypothetical protein
MATDPDDPNTPNGRISYKFLDDGLDAVAFNIGKEVFYLFFSGSVLFFHLRCTGLHSYHRPKIQRGVIMSLQLLNVVKMCAYVLVCICMHHIRKMYWRVGVKLHASLTWVLDRGKGFWLHLFLGKDSLLLLSPTRNASSLHFAYILNSQKGLRIFFTTVSTLALGPTKPPIQWMPGALSLGVKRPGREADHSPPTIAKVKNMWSYTSTLPICPHGVVLSLSTGTTLPLPYILNSLFL